jgi:hypothetical protein
VNTLKNIFIIWLAWNLLGRKLTAKSKGFIRICSVSLEENFSI